jgi:hypothetical protein
MRRSLTAAAVLAAGLTAVAVAAGPAFAGNGPGLGWGTGTGTATCDGTGTGIGGAAGAMSGQGRGMGASNGMGMGNRGGNGTGTGRLAASGTLTTAQRSDLLSMVEEEKLAHDVYVTLAAKYPADYQFSRIANAETQHQTALRTLLVRYGMDDPTAGLATGEFATASFQSLYGDLLGDATSATTALGVGVAIERLDISDLTDAMSGLTAPDVLQVYGSLRNGSEHHLAAFGG